jgi:hypothetical protein
MSLKQSVQAELQHKSLFCQFCGEPVECLCYKRSGYWAVVHGRGNGTLSFTTGETCKNRWEELARGETREEAESNFKQQNQ